MSKTYLNLTIQTIGFFNFLNGIEEESNFFTLFQIKILKHNYAIKTRV